MASGLLSTGERAVHTFDDVATGRVPPGFSFPGATQQSRSPWQVVRDAEGLGVLAHAATGNPGADLAVVESTAVTNIAVGARVRFAKGRGAAGLIWRYRDPDNYYLARVDVTAQEIRIYRVVGGNRTRLEEEDDLELDRSAWHTLKVEHRARRIRAWINGVPAADARDRALEEAGKAGLWASSDASVQFDDVFASVFEPPAGNPPGN
jgi:hypothetical protein